jgi:hypothetical protein
MAKSPAELFDETDPAPEAAPPQARDPAVTVAAEPQASAPPKLSGLRETLAELKFSGEFKDDREALEHLVNRSREAERVAGWANRGVEYDSFLRSPEYREYQEWAAARRAGSAPAPAEPRQPAAAGAPKSKYDWKPPEFDLNWKRLLSYGEDGRLAAIPGADPTLPQKYSAWQDFSEAQITRFLRDPRAFAREILAEDFESLREQARQIAREEFEVLSRQYQMQAGVNQVMAELDPWVWARDASGAILRDQQGRQQYSAEGLAYLEAIELLKDLPDPQLKHQAALRWIGRPAAAAAGSAGQGGADNGQPKPETPAEKSNRLKAAFVDQGRVPPGAGHAPNRAGTLGGDPLNPHTEPQAPLDLEAMMLAELHGTAV